MSAGRVLELLEARHDSGFLRLVALAWLVRRGLRTTACCCAGGVWDVAAAIGEEVLFHIRSTAGRRADRFDLGDGVIICRVGAWAAVEPVWAEHRRAHNRQRDLGAALGYLTPQTEQDQGEATLIHLAAFAGVQTEIWTEWLLPGAERAAIDAYTSRIRGALAEIGIEYSSWEKRI